MINNTVFQGRLVADPELRYTQSQTPVCSFKVAWSKKYKDTETKCFLPCTAWRNTGEFVSKYFTKGQEIIVRGELSTRNWEDKEGAKRSTIELTVAEASFCGSKQGGESGGGFKVAGDPVNISGPDGPTFAELDDPDGELPF